MLQGGLAAAAAAPPVRVHAQASRKTLLYAQNEDIGNLNPFAVNHAVFEALDNHIFEPLIRFDYDAGGFEPVLADSWAIENKGRTWASRSGPTRGPRRLAPHGGGRAGHR